MQTMPPSSSLRPPHPNHCFCTSCRSLTRSSFDTGQTITTNASGCALCDFLQRATGEISLTITAPTSIAYDDSQQLELEIRPRSRRYKPPYTVFTTTGNPTTTLYVREHVPGAPKGTVEGPVPKAWIRDGPQFSGIVTEWANLELARSWLQECMAAEKGAGHPQCTAADAASTMISDPLHPSTRFINIVEGRLEQLQDMAQPGLPPDYIALSYVWGTSGYHLKTLRSNRAAFSQGFNVRAPKTIRDAMVVTAELGYRYMWVDALCIVQDDPVEMREQIRQMNKVYDYAVATILAIGALSADHGIPGISIPRTASGPEIELPPGLAVGLWHEVDETGEEETYDTRGWTLQERLLSRRKLEFGTNRMVFECERGAREESGRKTEAERMSIFRMRKPEPTVPGVVTGPTILDVAWQDIKADFSKRNLYKVEDRLNAILGVTAAMEVVKGDGAFVCAHNQGKLYEDLLWQTEHGRDPQEEAQETCMTLLESGSDIFGALEPDHNFISEEDVFFAPIRFENKPHIISKLIPPLSRSNGLFPTWSWLNIWPIRYARSFHPLPNTMLLIQDRTDGDGWELVIEAPTITLTQEGLQELSHVFFDDDNRSEEEIECVAIAEVSSTSWLDGPPTAADGAGLWKTYVGALLLKKDKDGLHHVRIGMGLASHSLFSEGNGSSINRIICQ